MEFDDDISLGAGLANDQYDYESRQNYRDEAVRTANSRRNLLAGLIVSALVHAAIGAVLLRLNVASTDSPAPSIVQIQLTPSNPLLAALEEEPEELEEPVFEEAVIEEQPIEQQLVESGIEEIEPEQTQQQPSQDVEQAELADQVPTVTPATNPLPSPPTVLAIQRSLEVIEAERGSRFYSYSCNVIERKQGIRECEPINERDFSTLEENPVYDFHNPVRELSRSERTVTTLARNFSTVAANLAQSDLPPGLSAYVLEELEAGIAINSNNGNRVLQNMNRMIDRSAAALQARRIFDPWVQQQTKVLGARRIYTKQEIDQQRSCSDIVLALLTLPPAEFARCWTVGNKPLLLLNLFGL